jgi:hypothetical protein
MSVKPEMRGRKLKSSVNFKWTLKKKKCETGVKRGLSV